MADDSNIDMVSPLLAAVSAAGGDAALAARINDADLPLPRVLPKKRGHISTWKRRGACPPDMVLRIEAVTGVSRHRLRPDVFGYQPIDPPSTIQEAAE